MCLCYLCPLYSPQSLMLVIDCVSRFQLIPEIFLPSFYLVAFECFIDVVIFFVNLKRYPTLLNVDM